MRRLLTEINYNLLCFALVVALYIASCIPSINVEYMNYGVMIICIFLNAVKNNGILNLLTVGKNRLLFVIIVLAFIIFPFIQFIVYLNPYIIMNSFLYMIVVIYTMQVALDIVRNKNLETYILLCFTVSLLILFIQFLANPIQFFNLDNYTKIFDQETRVNYRLGFASSNTLAGLCFGTLTTSFFIRTRSESLLKKLYVWGGRIFTLIYLLNTGSRTSVTATALFVVVTLIFKFFWLFSEYEVSPKVLRGIKCFIFLLLGISVLIILSNVLGTYSYEELDKLTSYRLSGWVNILDYIGKDYWLLGGGLLNPNNLFRGRFPIKLIADNWIFFMYIAYGAIGFLFAALFEGYYFIRGLLNIDSICKIGTTMVFALIVSKIFYSFFEIAFFTPSDYTSLLMIILLYVGNTDVECFEYLE